ncbi:hypothetical protein [Collinsella tanakaei]|uniref:hypothetical protein n=1 Tax=Collinsella tanakaei TaxID=626935 RepID=UPI0025A3547E|nr:hypothetical protein [Collinsella tanakaei]MDM8301748.1 hypothetical protein [Collinsella tanakaei]
MAFTQDEYEALSADEREAACARVAETFFAAGADAVIHDFSELPTLVRQLG